MPSIAYYRERATELRTLAQATIDGAIQRALLKIADEYEQLAASCEIAGLTGPMSRTERLPQ